MSETFRLTDNQVQPSKIPKNEGGAEWQIPSNLPSQSALPPAGGSYSLRLSCYGSGFNNLHFNLYSKIITEVAEGFKPGLRVGHLV